MTVKPKPIGWNCGVNFSSQSQRQTLKISIKVTLVWHPDDHFISHGEIANYAVHLFVFVFNSGSETEERDIRKAYEGGKGCINYIMNSVPFMSVEDEPRIMEVVKGSYQFAH